MNLKLTEKAIEKIKEILVKNEMPLDSTYIRVGIKGKNCSGIVYSFNLDKEADAELDDLIVQDSVQIIYDKGYTEDISGIFIDYKESDGKCGFVFNNPLQVLGCGSCGSCNG